MIRRRDFIAGISGAAVAWSVGIFTQQDSRAPLLVLIQREQAEAAADKITGFIKEIERRIGWAIERHVGQLPWTPGELEDRILDAQRVLRQTPAITEFAQFDHMGRELLRVSPATFRLLSNEDFSESPWFNDFISERRRDTHNNNTDYTYYGPVYFRRESEPHMILAMGRDRADTVVSFAEINLTFVRDVVAQIKVGARGKVYVVDGNGRLIAHPDLSLVLRNIDLSTLAQVQAALAPSSEASERVLVAQDVYGRRVRAAYAPVAPLGWGVLVEEPAEEADSRLW